MNILREDQRDLSVRFAELPEGRFTGVYWRDTVSGSPWLDGALALLDCKTVQILDAGDHRMLIGEVLEVSVSDGRPLIFYRGTRVWREPAAGRRIRRPALPVRIRVKSGVDPRRDRQGWSPTPAPSTR